MHDGGQSRRGKLDKRPASQLGFRLHSTMRCLPAPLVHPIARSTSNCSLWWVAAGAGAGLIGRAAPGRRRHPHRQHGASTALPPPTRTKFTGVSLTSFCVVLQVRIRPQSVRDVPCRSRPGAGESHNGEVRFSRFPSFPSFLFFPLRSWTHFRRKLADYEASLRFVWW